MRRIALSAGTKSLSVRRVNLGGSLSRGVISSRSRSYITFPTGRRYAGYNDGNDDDNNDGNDDDVGTRHSLWSRCGFPINFNIASFSLVNEIIFVLNLFLLLISLISYRPFFPLWFLYRY